MGIKGIYNEIGPGQRIALSKLAIETLEQQGRPLRLAIDISIWLFQIQSGKGGTNPALRTFYYRLLRLISLSIHPLFVFDGPNKPPFKRGKRTGPNVASIPEFLAKQLLKQFALPFHIAPGEAEAECALLQQGGIVDAVLSEDVDTLMFGSALTLRNWSPEGTLKTRTFTHINLYDARNCPNGISGLDREGMILVALMSGGDYIPEGIPGCGPKTACEAARAGFGKDLCKIPRSDAIALTVWKDHLMHELRTNESKFFRSKHKALVIPDDFPRQDVLRYYTHPCVSPAVKLDSLRTSLKWDQDIDMAGLRTFCGEAFDWVCVSGAKKFIRNLAPALLVKQLRLRADDAVPRSDDTYDTAVQESQLIKTIHLARQHISTDNMNELRIGFIPVDLVPIDLEAEDPDPELPVDAESDEDEASTGVDVDGGDATLKSRGPLMWNPTSLEKIWLPETIVKLGAPLKLQDWEESFRNAQKYRAMKTMNKRAEKTHKATGGMPRGALDRFTKITKPGSVLPAPTIKDSVTCDDNEPPNEPPSWISTMLPTRCTSVDATQPSLQGQVKPIFYVPPALPPTPPRPQRPVVVELLSSPAAALEAPAKRKRTLRRSQSDASHLTSANSRQPTTSAMPAALQEVPSINPVLPALEDIPELPTSVTVRQHRSPLRRSQSIASASISQFHQTTLLDPQRPSFQPPPPLPKVPATSTTKAPNTLKAPQTPRKSKQSAIIIISSSPAPATPRSKQKSIAEYMSPSKNLGMPPPSPSPIKHRDVPGLPSQRAISASEQTPLEKPLSKPVFRLPLGTSQSATLNASFSSTDSTELSKHPKPSTTALPSHHPEATAKRSLARTGEYIQLRESLDGAWKLVDGEEDQLASAEEAGRKRKWRKSKVGILDLT